MSLAIALGLIVVVLAAVPAAASPPAGFKGRWEGTDEFDGSTITFLLRVERGSEGMALSAMGSESSCFLCDGEQAGIRAIGVLQEDPNQLEVSITAWGLGSSELVSGPLPGLFIYDHDTDTFTKLDGDVFHRVGR